MPVVTIPSTAYSLNLKPERKTSWEFGLDWRFVNNRFGLDFAFYKENTKDQIMSIPVPSVAGISRKLVNAGDIQNQGMGHHPYLHPQPFENQISPSRCR